jgi:tetratricopeptide (TPR) repeat protein
VAAHLRIAFADDGEELADVIGQHYRDALDAVPDDSDVEAIRRDAVAMMVRAAERAQRTGAPRAAADAYADAARLVVDVQAAEAADLLRCAATAAITAGDFADVVAFAEQAQTLFVEAGDRQGAATAQVLVARALGSLGRGREARMQLDAALTVLRPLRNADTVYALTELLSVEALSGTSTAQDLAAEVLILAESVGLADADLARVLISSGLAYACADRIALATALLREAARLSSRSGDRLLQSRALINLSAVRPIADPVESSAAADEGMEVSRRIGARDYLAYAYANRVYALLLIGDWQTAEADLRHAVEIDGLDDSDVLLSVRSMLPALQGDSAAAEALSKKFEVFGQSDAGQDIANLAMTVAGVAHARRDWREVLEQARIAISQISTNGLQSEVTFWAWWFGLDAARQIEDVGAVRELLDALEGHPPGHIPAALRAGMDLARAYLADGDADTADELYGRAIDAFRCVPAPYFLAVALLARGRAGDIAEATDLADQLGAKPLADRAAAALAQVS